MIKRILERLLKPRPSADPNTIAIAKIIPDGTKMEARQVTGYRDGVTQISVGKQSIVQGKIIFDRPESKISIGDRTFIGGGTKLVCAESISVGNDILISWGVTIVDHNSHAVAFSKREPDVVDWGNGKKDWTHVAARPVVLKDKCWIGFDAKILKGVTIGEGAVVGAASVVTKDVPDWTVVGGNPAKIIRVLAEHER